MSGENQIIMLSSFCKSLLCTQYHFLIQCLFLDVFKVAVSSRVSCENAVSRQVFELRKNGNGCKLNFRILRQEGKKSGKMNIIAFLNC